MDTKLRGYDFDIFVSISPAAAGFVGEVCSELDFIGLTLELLVSRAGSGGGTDRAEF